jgi:hypothetical protein
MSTELSTQVQTPMQMIQVAFDAAIKQGSAMEVVNLILEQQKWMIQHSEEEAYNATLKRIQKKLKSIPKRGWNPDTKSKFATSEDIDGEIQTLLDDENMTLSFRPAVAERPDEVLIIGLLSLGAYTREYPLNMPADGKGAKGGGVMSRTHATGAAITYGKRYLKNMIFDLRFDEKDDDGNGAGLRVSEAIAKTVSELLHCADMETLKEQYRREYKAAVEANDSTAVKLFMDAYTKRKAELA